MGKEFKCFARKKLTKLELYIKTMHSPVRKLAKKVIPVVQPLVVVMAPAISVYLAVLNIDEEEMSTDSDSVYILSIVFGIILLLYIWALCMLRDQKHDIKLVPSTTADVSEKVSCTECCQCIDMFILPG